jgi:hypothetical protein
MALIFLRMNTLYSIKIPASAALLREGICWTLHALEVVIALFRYKISAEDE